MDSTAQIKTDHNRSPFSTELDNGCKGTGPHATAACSFSCEDELH